MDQRERLLERAALGGDEDARRALHTSEFRRGARSKTLYLLSPDDSGVLHLVTRMGALCAFAHVARPESFRGTVVDGKERWATWAGPDDSLDDGRCEACHGQALLATNDRILKIFCWQIAHGRIVGNRHPDDDVEHYHLSNGRDLKAGEFFDCGTCDGSGKRSAHELIEALADLGNSNCPVCLGRGWLQRTRR